MVAEGKPRWLEPARCSGVVMNAKIAPVNAHGITVAEPAGKTVVWLVGGVGGCRVKLKMKSPAKFQTLVHRPMGA
jgi:hypothetical protein